MAKQIRRELVLCNFRTLGPRPKKKTTWRKSRPGMSDSHLADIRKLPCCVCGRHPGGEAHHLKAGTGERGGALRSTDRWAVPVCRTDHNEIERIGSRNEPAYFERIGIAPLVLAAALWSNRGDLMSMLRVLQTHRDNA